MKYHWCLLAVALFAVSASALPFDDSQEDFGESSSSRTWGSVKKFFQPMVDWFRNDLPTKTPKDLATDIKDAAVDAKDWASENKFVRGTADAFRPVGQWFKDTANSLKDKSFSDMFYDSKTAVAKADDSVGGWIEDQIQ